MNYTRIMVDDRGWLVSATNIDGVPAPRPLEAGELDRGMADAVNPIRYDIGYQPPFGKYTKWQSREAVEMTVEEKAIKDAEDAEAIAEAEADRQAGKPAALKVAENYFIMVCDAVRGALGQPATHTKLATFDYQAMLEQIGAVDKVGALEFAAKAQAMMHEIEVQGGSWNDTIWHQEVM